VVRMREGLAEGLSRGGEKTSEFNRLDKLDIVGLRQIP
jgi:hypothetical protein